MRKKHDFPRSWHAYVVVELTDCIIGGFNPPGKPVSAAAGTCGSRAGFSPQARQMPGSHFAKSPVDIPPNHRLTFRQITG